MSFMSLKGLLFGIGLITLAEVRLAPGWAGWLFLSLGLVTMLGGVYEQRLEKWVLRSAAFVAIPFAVYFSQLTEAQQATEMTITMTHALYLLLSLSIIFVIRLTRRSGYSSTPMDLLIFLVILSVPVWPSLSWAVRVMVCLPSVRLEAVMIRDALTPKAPSRLEVQLSAASSSSPSSTSHALPSRMMA